MWPSFPFCPSCLVFRCICSRCHSLSPRPVRCVWSSPVLLLVFPRWVFLLVSFSFRRFPPRPCQTCLCLASRRSAARSVGRCRCLSHPLLPLLGRVLLIQPVQYAAHRRSHPRPLDLRSRFLFFFVLGRCLSRCLPLVTLSFLSLSSRSCVASVGRCFSTSSSSSPVLGVFLLSSVLPDPLPSCSYSVFYGRRARLVCLLPFFLCLCVLRPPRLLLRVLGSPPSALVCVSSRLAVSVTCR